MSRSTIIDIDFYIHARTERAVLVSESKSDRDAVWLPLSMIEVQPHERMQNVFVISMEEQFAIDKGLV